MDKKLTNRWKNVKSLAQDKKEVKNEQPSVITKIVNLSKDKGEIFNIQFTACKAQLILFYNINLFRNKFERNIFVPYFRNGVIKFMYFLYCKVRFRFIKMHHTTYTIHSFTSGSHEGRQRQWDANCYTSFA